MEIKYGLVSCDSHAQLHKDTWVKRMSQAKFGDKIHKCAKQLIGRTWSTIPASRCSAGS
jgi:hypothetical protein